MQTIEGLKRKIASTEDLQSVVKTMKALAAVSIRQYERAVESLEDYSEAVEKGLQAVLQSSPGALIAAKPAPRDRLGAIVFGSDQGMCGQLNDQIGSYALDVMENRIGVSRADRAVIAVGLRVSAQLADEGQEVEDTLEVPGSVAGITPAVQEILPRIEAWGRDRALDQIFLFYSRPLSGAAYEPHMLHLLPVDQQWLKRLKERQWPTRQLPLYTVDRDLLFSDLIRQYLFISLFRAFAESLASENASRLASMQGAERNIQELLGDLNRQFHQQRQMSITEELLDIVSGFEALNSPD